MLRDLYLAYTTSTTQVNKHNKSADRGIIITDKFIYKLDVKKKFKPMAKGSPLTEVSSKISFKNKTHYEPLSINFLFD